MRRAILIHWRQEEGDARLPAIRKAGWQAECYCVASGKLKPLRDNPPELFVIDLTRYQTGGTGVAAELRRSKRTRHVPIVFVGGPPEKVAKARERIPDAVYCEWENIGPAMIEALRTTPEEPFVPVSLSGTAYSPTPLPKKLGIKEGSVLTLLNAPLGFAHKLRLPETVKVHERPAAAHRVMLFVRDSTELNRGFPKALKCVEQGGGLWVAWPKKTSGVQTDINENHVRDLGLSHGWVDYRVCAVDETWSGLLFAPQRKTGSKVQ